MWSNISEYRLYTTIHTLIRSDILQVASIISYISHNSRLQAVRYYSITPKGREIFESVLGMLKKEPLAQFSFC